MIKCVTLLIMSAHWYACIIALQTTLHTYAHETWLVKFGYCPEALEDHLLTVTHCTSEGTGVPVATWYLACYSWALLVITGAGVGGYSGSRQCSLLVRCHVPHSPQWWRARRPGLSP